MKRFWNSIVSFFRGPHWRKAQEVASFVSELLPYALNAVNIIAMFSGNKTVKDIHSLLLKLSIPKEEFNFDPTRDYTKAEINGILLGAASFALRGELNKAIEEAGEAGLVIAGNKLKSSTEIPDNVINTAINTAYTFVKNS